MTVKTITRKMNSSLFSNLLRKRPLLAERKCEAWKGQAAIILLSCLTFSANASAQTAQWVKQMGTGGISNGVSSDAAGNTYATGFISNPGLFDDLNIPCNASDVFLAKYDSTGIIQWVTLGGGPLLDQGNDIVTDAAGNSYVVGAIQTNGPNPTAQFGGFTLTGNGDYDWLIVKYDTLGNVLWAKNYGSSAGDIARGVALDPSGNVYVTGFYSSSMTVQGVTVMSRGLFDVFLAKFDTNGTLLWLRSAGGAGSDIGHGVVVDSQGNVGLTGEFQSKATFGTHSVTAAAWEMLSSLSMMQRVTIYGCMAAAAQPHLSGNPARQSRRCDRSFLHHRRLHWDGDIRRSFGDQHGNKWHRYLCS